MRNSFYRFGFFILAILSFATISWGDDSCQTQLKTLERFITHGENAIKRKDLFKLIAKDHPILFTETHANAVGSALSSMNLSPATYLKNSGNFGARAKLELAENTWKTISSSLDFSDRLTDVYPKGTVGADRWKYIARDQLTASQTLTIVDMASAANTTFADLFDKAEIVAAINFDKEVRAEVLQMIQDSFVDMVRVYVRQSSYLTRERRLKNSFRASQLPATTLQATGPTLIGGTFIGVLSSIATNSGTEGLIIGSSIAALPTVLTTTYAVSKISASRVQRTLNFFQKKKAVYRAKKAAKARDKGKSLGENSEEE